MTPDAEPPTRESLSAPPEWVTPWADKTAANRTAPRECVRAARDSLNRAYGLTGPAPYPLLIDAVDWLRRALEQMVPGDCPVCGAAKVVTFAPGEHRDFSPELGEVYGCMGEGHHYWTAADV